MDSRLTGGVPKSLHAPLIYTFSPLFWMCNFRTRWGAVWSVCGGPPQRPRPLWPGCCRPAWPAGSAGPWQRSPDSGELPFPAAALVWAARGRLPPAAAACAILRSANQKHVFRRRPVFDPEAKQRHGVWGSALTWAEYLTLRRSASQPLSQARSCRALSSSPFRHPQVSTMSLIFFSQSTRRRSISFRRLRLASMASRRRPFFATFTNSSSCANISSCWHNSYPADSTQCLSRCWCGTCWRLRLACTAAASFSSCFTLIRMISCRTFSRASFVSMPLYSICLRVSISGQTIPANGADPSGGRATLWGVRLGDTLVQADGGEARDEEGRGPGGKKVYTIVIVNCYTIVKLFNFSRATYFNATNV